MIAASRSSAARILAQPSPEPPDPGALLALGFELAVATVLFLLGVRSLLRWMRTEFRASTRGEHALYLLHVTSRVATWFALAAYLVGIAVADEPQALNWYWYVLVGLPTIQLLTGFRLSRFSYRGEGSEAGAERGVARDASGNGWRVNEEPSREPVGPLAEDKRGETSEPGRPQPEAAEVESARLLGNQAREALRASGLSDEDIRRLADAYVAEDRGEDLQGFIEWARARARRAES